MVADTQVGRGRELRRPAAGTGRKVRTQGWCDVKDSYRRPREIAAGPKQGPDSCSRHVQPPPETQGSGADGKLGGEGSRVLVGGSETVQGGWSLDLVAGLGVLINSPCRTSSEASRT